MILATHWGGVVASVHLLLTPALTAAGGRLARVTGPLLLQGSEGRESRLALFILTFTQSACSFTMAES